MAKESPVTMYKLMEIVGCPSWFQRTQWSQLIDGSTYLKIVTNARPPLEDLTRIPAVIDGIPIRIVYRKHVRL